VINIDDILSGTSICRFWRHIVDNVVNIKETEWLKGNVEFSGIRSEDAGNVEFPGFEFPEIQYVAEDIELKL
jgi:hypothetical protein